MRKLALTLGLILASVSQAAAADFHVRVNLQDSRAIEFAETGKALCEEWYPKINAAIFGPDYALPFDELELIFEPSIFTGSGRSKTVIPAYSRRNAIHINTEYVAEVHQQLPDDYAGMMIHELTHIVQQYPGAGEPGWLVEGIADYVRHKYFAKDIEPQLYLDSNGSLTGYELDRNKGDFATEGYRAGYTVTGAFLYWLEVRKDKDIVPVLNRALRDRRYSAKMFQERCGAPVEALWRDFVSESRGEIVLASGERLRAPKIEGQIGFDRPLVSPDHRTVGWLALFANPDPQGAPLPGALVLYRAGRILQTFSADQVLWDWQFQDSGKRVAYSDGPLHGGATECVLREVDSGRIIARFHVRSTATPPEWARTLRQ